MEKLSKILLGCSIFMISLHTAEASELNKESVQNLTQQNNNNEVYYNLINYDRDKFTKHGEDVKVAILDTKINHADINIESYKSFLFEEESDLSVHGNSIAGIIGNKNINHLGIANEAEIHSIEILNHNATGNIASITSGLEWAVNNDFDVINFSISIPSNTSKLDRIMKQAEKNDVVIVVPSGNNEYTNSLAEYKNVVTVASVNNNGLHSNFSNISNYVDISAPGEDIYTTSIADKYHNISGTSISTAFVTGAFATIKSNHPNETNSNIMKKILNNATKTKDKKEYGNGLLNMDVY